MAGLFLDRLLMYVVCVCVYVCMYKEICLKVLAHVIMGASKNLLGPMAGWKLRQDLML